MNRQAVFRVLAISFGSAAITSVVTLFIAARDFHRQTSAAPHLVQAAKDIAKGETISSGSLEAMLVAPSKLSVGAITDQSEAVGRVANHNIKAGAVVFNRDLSLAPDLSTLKEKK